MKSFFFTLTLSFLTISFLTAQTGILTGTITDTDGEPLPAATLQVQDNGVFTDMDGVYSMELEAGDYEVVCTFIGYSSKRVKVTIVAGQTTTLNISLAETATLLNTATVTSGKFEKPLGEVTVSLEVIKPALLESTNATAVDQVLEKIPGVNIIDGQANIRGGSGFSYGAGSRV
ncbi:MAG: carboxypeptidase-like regulatory domain-containing protein, partial [Phaeodactylibacter sp.]|nr:carboxypeptidase-like regulatory domain-containing protein [Phaeodactylibacter sp.]